MQKEKRREKGASIFTSICHGGEGTTSAIISSSCSRAFTRLPRHPRPPVSMPRPFLARTADDSRRWQTRRAFKPTTAARATAVISDCFSFSRVDFFNLKSFSKCPASPSPLSPSSSWPFYSPREATDVRPASVCLQDTKALQPRSRTRLPHSSGNLS